MKYFLLSFILALFSCASLNAQENVSESLEYRGGHFYQDGVKLSSGQVFNMLGKEVYEEVYKPAKYNKSAGISAICVGSISAAVGAAILTDTLVKISKGNSSSTYSVNGFLKGASTFFGGTALAVGGGLMIKHSNNTMKSLCVTSDGAGLAFVF